MELQWSVLNNRKKHSMKRKQTKPTAILCGDIHLREDTPVCRLDEYEKAMWSKIDWLSDLQKKYDCPVLDSGDLFHRWKPSPYLLSKAIQHLPDELVTVPGNHDLPQHNLEMVGKSGLAVLSSATAASVFMHAMAFVFRKIRVYGCPYGEIPEEPADVLIWHVMTYQGKKPWPGCKDMSAKGILKKYPQYKLILTGHNHIPFVEELDGRLLVNPGSMMRMNADQVNHKPRVYLWYAETNTVEPVYYPIEEDVVTRGHIDVVENRDERLDSFIERLNTDCEIDLSFTKNMEGFISGNKVKKSIKNKIWEAVDGER